MPNNWCFWIVVLEKALQISLDSRSNQLVLKKSTLNIQWRTDDEAVVPVLWSPDTKSQLIGKDPDAEKDWGQEEKGVTEDEMFGWTSVTQRTWVWANLSKLRELLKEREACHAAVHGVTKS